MVYGNERLDEDEKAGFLTEEGDTIARVVLRIVESEEAKATLEHVRAQRDALAAATRATTFFLRVGGLVTRDELTYWRQITNSSDFTLHGLHDFVRAQMDIAGVMP